ncbi:MAG: hypothetical protein QXT53_02040 [Ignisphaera sp.]
MSKFSRMSIPKNEEDIQRISEEIMKSEGAEEEHEHETISTANLDMISHQLAHIQELLIHVIQSIRELRDSVDGLASATRRSLKTLGLVQFMNNVNDPELRSKILDQVLKELGIEAKK